MGSRKPHRRLEAGPHPASGDASQASGSDETAIILPVIAIAVGFVGTWVGNAISYASFQAAVSSAAVATASATAAAIPPVATGTAVYMTVRNGPKMARAIHRRWGLRVRPTVRGRARLAKRGTTGVRITSKSFLHPFKYRSKFFAPILRALSRGSAAAGRSVESHSLEEIVCSSTEDGELVELAEMDNNEESDGARESLEDWEDAVESLNR